MHAAHSTRPAAFAAKRSIVFAVALASYVLSFFHRTAPAAIAGELTQTFAISGAVLGTLAATYFYVYTVLQVPVGILADTLGPRRILTAGSLVAAAGSFAFAFAPTWEIAAVGRTLVGVGVAVSFIGILKINALWFAPHRFATVNGVTLFAGNLGAVLAGAPLALALTQTSWRTVFAILGGLSAVLAVATWHWVRDRPQDFGFAAVASVAAPTRATNWRRGLADVLRNPRTWPGVFVNVGVGGTYLAFAGLWAVPYMQEVHGLSRVVAAQHASALLLGVAVGSVAIGILSDRLGNRRAVMRVYTALYALSWLPWLLHVAWPLALTLAWFLTMGLLIPGFFLTWAVAKEVNRPENSGIATSVVNVGAFLGTGILQPVIGSLLDRGRAAGDAAGAWDQAIAVFFASSVLGALCTWAVRERPVAPGAHAG